MLHEKMPDLMNSTVRLFSAEGEFNKTCFPSFSSTSSKGWCATRPPGVFKNEIPTADSGWGFCSNDASQVKCNKHVGRNIEDDTPYGVTFLRDQFCVDKLKDNLQVEQPKELDDKFKGKVDNSQTVCVGQMHNHSFENEQFVVVTGLNYDVVNRTPILEVRITVSVLKSEIFLCNI